ncbi:hypothetical protein SDC9_184063 [bioreactor metagenome]|uniref:Uncharacterized protein n=1 Tax=bioreactor metagenome TaxID=1076179 RepID=A0A645HK94_9ZZZZ
MHLFQGEHNAGKRGVEGRCQTGGGSACDEVIFFQLVSADFFSQGLASGCADLDGRALASKGKAKKGGQNTGQISDREDGIPLDAQPVDQLSLHLGNSASGGHWLKLDQPRDQQPRGKDTQGPRQDQQRMQS